MGCLWSREAPEHCMHFDRRAVNNLVIIDHTCEICISKATSNQRIAQPGPKFGEYRCGACRRYWTSRLCWPNKYQMCKRCHKAVLPFQYRDLCATDVTKFNEIGQEHVKELCQMCQQLGHSCTQYGKKYNSKLMIKI